MNTICKNCGCAIEAKYCGNCGQKHYSEKDKSFHHILEESLHFITHLEGSLPRTIKTVLFYPAKLSDDYCDGIRKKYYKPISLFLLLVVIYLLFPYFAGLNQELTYYGSMPVFGSSFKGQMEDRMLALHLSESEFSELFHHKAEKLSKILLLLLIPITAFSLKLLYPKHRRPMFDHFILATEFNCFIILFVFLIVGAILNPLMRLLQLSYLSDTVLMPFMIVVTLPYTFLALKRFYGLPWFTTMLKTLAFIGLYAIGTQFVYKSVLFVVTMAFV